VVFRRSLNCPTTENNIDNVNRPLNWHSQQFENLLNTPRWYLYKMKSWPSFLFYLILISLLFTLEATMVYHKRNQGYAQWYIIYASIFNELFPLLRDCQSIVLLFPLSNYYYYYYIALLHGLRISHDKALSRVYWPINSIVRVSTSHRHSPTSKLVHLVFMPARVQLSSDIGLFLAERLLQ